MYDIPGFFTEDGKVYTALLRKGRVVFSDMAGCDAVCGSFRFPNQCGFALKGGAVKSSLRTIKYLQKREVWNWRFEKESQSG